MSETLTARKPPRKSVQMRAADAAWLHMEDPTNLMMITALFTFKKPLDRDLIRKAVVEGLLPYDRFQMKAISQRIGRPSWNYYPEFDVDQHLEVLQLESPGGEEQLLGLVSQLMGVQLERDKALWKFHIVQGYEGGSALIVRLHHAIADGIALLKVLLSLTEPSPDSESRGDQLLEAPQRKTASLLHDANIKVKPRKFIDLARIYSSAAADLGKVLIETEPVTPLRGKLGIAKSAARTKPLSLDVVKEARGRAGCTVNDFLMAAVAGGVRAHLQRLKTPLTPGLNVRAVIPVDLRKPTSKQTLGNRFGLVFLGLPVGLDDPKERLAEVQRRMQHLKTSPQAVVVLGLLKAVGSIPAEMQNTIVELFGSKASAVVTNVPGPREHLYLASQAIESLMFWVPQSGRLGLGLSILSYGGQVRIGVATDAGLTTDANLLASDIEAAFEELVACV